MKALVTGGGGQLSKALIRTAEEHHQISVHSIETLDITCTEQVRRAMDEVSPDVIINAAAYTAVDKAESEEVTAKSVNEDGPRNLARAASEHGSRLIHISTDFVFDGVSQKPWLTTDVPKPVSVYGRTKLAGEQAIIDSDLDEWTIVRTAWLYDGDSPNFVSTMLRLMKDREDISVVSDQTGTPTLVDSLAVAVWCLADNHVSGMHHWTDDGCTTWHGFATAIEEIGYRSGLLASRTRVDPITTEDYPTPARRPSYSVLDKTKTWNALEGTRAMPSIHWRENLNNMITEKMRV